MILKTFIHFVEKYHKYKHYRFFLNKLKAKLKNKMHLHIHFCNH